MPFKCKHCGKTINNYVVHVAKVHKDIQKKNLAKAQAVRRSGIKKPKKHYPKKKSKGTKSSSAGYQGGSKVVTKTPKKSRKLTPKQRLKRLQKNQKEFRENMRIKERARFKCVVCGKSSVRRLKKKLPKGLFAHANCYKKAKKVSMVPKSRRK